MTVRPLTAEAHLGLVIWLAAQLVPDDTLREDAVQAGYVGLLEALRRFDPTRGTSFSSYAVPWIKKYVYGALRSERPAPVGDPAVWPHAAQHESPWDTLVVKDALATLTLKERRVLELRFGLGTEPPQTLAASGQRLGMPVERVRLLERLALTRLRQAME